MAKPVDSYPEIRRMRGERLYGAENLERSLIYVDHRLVIGLGVH